MQDKKGGMEMPEVVTNLIVMLINWIKGNYKKPKLWILAILLVVFMYGVIPYIDSYFFYYDRMEKRISILQQMTELDSEKISSNEVLQKEYEDILNDIQDQEERMESSIVTNISDAINNIFMTKPQEGNVWFKFLSGAALSLIIALCIPFMNTFSSKKQKITALILVLIIALILGIIGAIIPTIISPKVNYWGMPLVQVVGLGMLIIKFGKIEEKEEE